MRIHLISLGCPKNLVDSEIILGGLLGADVELVANPEDAETVIINTCGFIEGAKEESIDTILRVVELKNQGCCRNLFVTGCLYERYPEELEKEIPEVDGFFGVKNIKEIPFALAKRLNLKRPTTVRRVLSTPSHYAYLKIAEGCDNPCGFCTIPQIRGNYRSRDSESILEEAESLVRQGVRELIVVAQDTTAYGCDLDGEENIVSLLEKLTKIEPLEWIRLLYTYPSRLSENLIDFMAENDKICKYLDLPLQHISDSVLKAMGRDTSRKDIEGLIEKLRAKIPNLALRTTFMVGFPGEEEEDFQELLQFVRATKFERLGVFTYSQEEDTPAASFHQQIPEEVKRERFCQIMQLQQQISKEINCSQVGKELEIVVDAFDEQRNCFLGRTQWDCPEVDNAVILYSKVEPGKFYRAEIINALEYDLIGRVDGVK